MKKYWIHLVLMLVTTILAGIAFQQGGFPFVFEGFRRGASLLLHEIPLLVAAFLTAGFLQALVKKETVTRWLGEESGFRGILLACLGGGLIPGGPYAYYPIANALLKSGAGIGVLVAFVSAKNLWSVSRLPLEIAILGSRVTILRFSITFLIPPVLGIVAARLFGHLIDKIRRGIQ
jgi:uncharacterized membrane protein YraQ (UPF0718 family)